MELPPELQHLIEKRELDDRRTEQRRKQETRPPLDPSPHGDDLATDCSGGSDEPDDTIQERRSGQERREQIRRSSDGEKAC
jgi:hypothetical protein